MRHGRAGGARGDHTHRVRVRRPWHAIARYERSLRACAGASRPLVLLATALLRLGRSAEAAHASGAALQVEPGSCAARRLYVRALLALGLGAAAAEAARGLPIAEARELAAEAKDAPAALTEGSGVAAWPAVLVDAFPVIAVQTTEVTSSGAELAERGARLIEDGDLDHAVAVLVQALKAGALADVGDVLNNVSFAALQVGAWEAALAAAAAASLFFSAGDVKLAKARLRYTEAAAQLGLPCAEGLIALVDDPKRRAALAEVPLGRRGLVNWDRVWSPTAPVSPSAEFVGPLQVRSSAGKGRGLFVTRPCVAGELLYCVRPLVRIASDPERDTEHSYGDTFLAPHSQQIAEVLAVAVNTEAGAHLLGAVHALCDYDAEERADLAPIALLAGRAAPALPFLTAQAVLPAFDPGRAIEAQLLNEQALDVRTGDTPAGLAGLCGLYALMNHAEKSNTVVFAAGQMVVCRAAYDLPAGAELLTRYCEGDAYLSEQPLAFWRISLQRDARLAALRDAAEQDSLAEAVAVLAAASGAKASAARHLAAWLRDVGRSEPQAASSCAARMAEQAAAQEDDAEAAEWWRLAAELCPAALNKAMLSAAAGDLSTARRAVRVLVGSESALPSLAPLFGLSINF